METKILTVKMIKYLIHPNVKINKNKSNLC